jgi:molybdopterin/thiamine biosynthesis adenylyltransferase
MTDDNYRARFKDCIWFSNNFPAVTVGGVGGIGSWLAMFLGRQGIPMKVYDDDFIEYTNMGGQCYPTSSIGKSKAQVVQELVKDFSGGEEVELMGRYKYGDPLTNIVFSGFDNMEARADMFASWYEKNQFQRATKPAIFIDGRMTVESYQIYAVTPDRAERYKETLFHDNEVGDLACSMKATSHIGAEIGSKMVQIFNNYMTNYKVAMDLRDVPFKLRYESCLIFTEIEI